VSVCFERKRETEREIESYIERERERERDETDRFVGTGLEERTPSEGEREERQREI
jgi:hypothetical protein